jgi:hypothetical protein
MPEENDESRTAWWRAGGSSPDTPPASSSIGWPKLRNEHWTFFEENVLPEMSRLVRTTFPSDIAETIRNRISNGSRFRASELLYALLADLDRATTAAGIWACAGVEFLLLSRLTHDDVVDNHDYRWGLPTLQMLYGPNKASLASTELLALALICCAEVDALVARRAGTSGDAVSAPVLAADYARKMAASMLDELLFNDVALAEREYNEISERKLCNGVLCAQLCKLISDDLDSADRNALVTAAGATDIAASIANDMAETDQRRGLDAVRFPQGEQRGERTEFQLGRPTIFHVFMASDERVRNERSTEVTVNSIDLREMSPAQLFATLTELGGIDFARRKRDFWMQNAFESIPPDFRKATEWMGSTARLNVRTV